MMNSKRKSTFLRNSFLVMALCASAMIFSVLMPVHVERQVKHNQKRKEVEAPIIFTDSRRSDDRSIFIVRSSNECISFQCDRIVFAWPNSSDHRIISAIGNQFVGPRKYKTENENNEIGYNLLTLHFINMNKDCVIEGLDSLHSTMRIFHGRNSMRDHRQYIQYKRIKYRNIYPGIDLDYFSKNGALKYEFTIKPGANPSNICMRYEGHDSISLAPDGQLLVYYDGYQLKDSDPFSYYLSNDTRIPVSSCYQRIDNQTYKYHVDEYDGRCTLIIDPGYTTFLGGAIKDSPDDLIIGKNGNIILVGWTLSFDYPLTHNAFQTIRQGDQDLFVSVLSPDGDSLLASTLLGGSGIDAEGRISLDPDGNIVVTAYSYTDDYPITNDAYQRRFGGGACDGVISILDPLCTKLLYSSYLGGSGYDQIYGLTLDEEGNIYVTGLTDSRNFPVTVGAYQRIYGGGEDDVFITKLEPDGKNLVYSTFLGGGDWEEGYAITLDKEGNATICGFTRDDDFPTTTGAFQSVRPGEDDGFVTKINTEGRMLIYSTYLGGDDNNDVCFDLVSDDSGGVYITGFTHSINFPTTSGTIQPRISTNHSRDCFVSHLDENGSTLSASTYFGSYGSNDPFKIRTHDNLLYMVGNTAFGSTFPVTQNAGSDSLRGEWDGFIVIMSADLTNLVYSGLIGGDQGDVCIAMGFRQEQIVIAGNSNSTSNFHLSNGIMKGKGPGSIDVMLVFLSYDELLFTGKTPNVTSDFSILPLFPNPVQLQSGSGTANMTIPFRLLRASSVVLEIYDRTGRVIERKEYGILPPGSHAYPYFAWDLSPGVYFCRVIVSGKMQTNKFVVIR